MRHWGTPVRGPHVFTYHSGPTMFRGNSKPRHVKHNYTRIIGKTRGNPGSTLHGVHRPGCGSQGVYPAEIFYKSRLISVSHTLWGAITYYRRETSQLACLVHGKPPGLVIVSVLTTGTLI